MYYTSSISLPLFLLASPFHAFRRMLSYACVQPSIDALLRIEINIFSFFRFLFYLNIYIVD